jgi:hypothetical protein
LEAEWRARCYWHYNVEETNQLMADFLQWPVEDLASVIGANGKSLEGGTYMSTSTNPPASAVFWMPSRRLACLTAQWLARWRWPSIGGSSWI